MKYLTICFCALFFFFSQAVLAQGPDRISKIEVTGNEKIERGLVLNAIKTKESDSYDLGKLREDMRSIYKTGYFSDVQIDVKDTDKGKVVTFVVIERPTIKSIYLTGNKKIQTPDIRDKLKFQTNTVLNIEKIKQSIDDVKKLYASKGYYGAKVNYEVDYGDGYDVSVTLRIDEPPKAFVKKITFTGNKAFKDSKIKDYMTTKEKGLLSWFTGSGILDEEVLDDDRKNVEAFYADNGYVRAKAGIPDIKISPDGKSITVSIPIEEGKVYTIAAIDFTGDIIVPKEDLSKKVESKPGKVFRASLFQKDLLMLTDLYQDQGFAFVEVSPLTLINDDSREINLTFDVSKGKEIFINRINILGNVRTRDKVIRREMKLAEGDRFSSTLLKESQRRLTNTTYFKTIDTKIAKTDEPDKVNLDVTVEEKPTGSISAGIGYSTTDKVIISGSVSQENFFGTGRKLFLEAALSSVTQQFRLTYVEPYILDSQISGSLTAFNYGKEFDTYDYEKRGGGFGLSRPIRDNVTASFAYRLERVNVTNITLDASEYIQTQRGTKTTSAINFGLAKNTIDNIMNPTKGINSKINLEIAGGPFSGDNYFYKVVASYGRYFPIKFLDSRFFFRATAGTIQPYGGRELPVYEKFFVGGIDSVRGFKYGEAGPTDSTGEVIGAKHQLFFNFEWIFPIFKPAGVNGVLFYDLGGGSDSSKLFLGNDLRSAAGAGIRWNSPLGPIRLELGINLFPKKGEKRNVFDFTIGTQY